MRRPPNRVSQRRVWRLHRALCLLVAVLFGALCPPLFAAPGDGEGILAIYLPGVYFARLEDKVELGNELAQHLAKHL
ncbi:MAG TPA: hypothetical protein PKI03_18340, partial [Pseudomonadota bacterium]|nr:hypothetical protein [Pseudomonadota bacterium]